MVPGSASVSFDLLPAVADGDVQPEPARARRPQLPPVALRHPGHPDLQTVAPPGPAPPCSRTGVAVVRSSFHGPESHPVFVADPDAVQLDDPPSRAGVVAVSVSLRHQRSSVTTHRPAPASRRSATGRTRSPFQTTATVSARPRKVTWPAEMAYKEGLPWAQGAITLGRVELTFAE